LPAFKGDADRWPLPGLVGSAVILAVLCAAIFNADGFLPGATGCGPPEGVQTIAVCRREAQFHRSYSFICCPSALNSARERSIRQGGVA